MKRRERNSKPDPTRIPLCKSDYLQDILIQIGRHLKALRYATGPSKLTFITSFDDVEGREIERVDIQVSGLGSGLVGITVWENARARYFKRVPQPKHAKAKDTIIFVDFAGLEMHQIVSLIEESIRDRADVYLEWRALEKRDAT